ncbi:hypothetical protein JQ574_28925 [Bradyrhizobium sp. AUGA SZCCT0158]|uniref:hypothetical protein n=1 Tax=Bradyrhizobium sp. AUGA SZCCT0158 TaxID=2807661 RepID=UPI001BA65D88|nr:hypothetical protein [Bradyrhizobium sp. AUGA SZCCT0158]MBR1200021.1 hypothetical protein [Bradyrhizobium sp. AUGA SZCCT0158]
MNAQSSRQKYCGGACRKAHYMAQFAGVELDHENEIVVKDLEECPRRARIARIVEAWEYGQPRATKPEWMNPADRRHWR